MKPICVLAVLLFAAVGTFTPKPKRVDQPQVHAFLSADPIPICPMKRCPTLPVPSR